VEVLRWAGLRPAVARSSTASWLPAAWVALLLCAPAWALSVDSHSQLHAVIGQPLSLDLPVSFAGINANAVTVRVAPGPDLADEEAAVAESVQASYDAVRSVVHLSTAQRVMVPALSLHLVVTAGALVVNNDVDVLVDVPDLRTQHTARADAAVPAVAVPQNAVAEPAAQGLRLLAIQKPETPARGFGDAAGKGAMAAAVANSGADADAQRPSVTPPPPPPPPDPRPKTWLVRPGDTLGGISRRLAPIYEVTADAMALALYEANSSAFSLKAPEQAIPGRMLQVPEDFVSRGEPAGRVAQFRAWLRQPQGAAWQPRAYLPFSQPQAPPLAAPRPQLLGAIALVSGVALLLLVAALLLRRLRLRPLLTRYVPMSSIQVKKIKRIIIPAPPPRRGLSQGTVTEKLRIKRLREVLDDHPFRSDIRYQLAQRLHKAGDGRTFAQIAPPLRPSLSPEAWARVCAMGRELLPDDPRFQQS